MCVQVVDADTQKAMMAWYYKKQEEQKVRPRRVGRVLHAADASLAAAAEGCHLPCPPCCIVQALSADEDDAYNHSAWANSKSLKQHFSGVTSVRIPR